MLDVSQDPSTSTPTPSDTATVFAFDETAELSRLQPEARWSLRLQESDATAIGEIAGFDLTGPINSCRAGTDDGDTARRPSWSVRLGPNEWLLAASRDELAARQTALARGLANRPHGLVEISDRQVAFRRSGPSATSVLASGCPLDLHAQSFPVGMATRTVFAKCEIVLHRAGESEFRIQVWRSFSNYFTSFIAETAAMYSALNQQKGV
ncbi:MAG: sarcosine oxidase subunit gamma family protein [Pseudomonadota bacterium]